MDFGALVLTIKEKVSKRLEGHSLDLTGALKRGLTRGVLIVGVVLLLFTISVYTGIMPRGSFHGRMPQCDSSFIRELLIKAVNQSPAGQNGLKVLKVNEIGDFAVVGPLGTSGDPEAEARNCSAFTLTNAGKAIFFFELTWSSPKKDEVWLEITKSSL
ncbi:hypothetical protein [Bradyrhizobium sp. ARR65]|uniref:hypothetical protein n=1 Tax=Bradyrhizobium sp. ARR65 TaxID=1040989 RepID=UPI0004647CEB|nr:hypothetical protein [Bradyrhizobium sp. ARR65]